MVVTDYGTLERTESSTEPLEGPYIDREKYSSAPGKDYEAVDIYDDETLHLLWQEVEERLDGAPQVITLHLNTMVTVDSVYEIMSFGGFAVRF